LWAICERRKQADMNVFTKGAVVALATTALLVGAGDPGADAAVLIKADGTVHVDKSDVQAAFKWTNADFDRFASGVTFNLGSATFWQHFERACNGQNFVGTLTITDPRTAIPTMLKSGNGKQVTGWDLRVGTGTQVIVDDNYWAARAGFDNCANVDNGVLGESHSSGGQTVDWTITVTSGGVSKVLTPTSGV
jgi:hypothetical protein